MKVYIYLLLFCIFNLFGCSSGEYPNTGYYQTVAQSSERETTFNKSSNSSRNAVISMRETLRKERAWHRRELAQKNSTIESLRKDLYQTRTHLSSLMGELNKVHSDRQTASLYRDAFVNASAEIREPIQRKTLEEEKKSIPIERTVEPSVIIFPSTPEKSTPVEPPHPEFPQVEIPSTQEPKLAPPVVLREQPSQKTIQKTPKPIEQKPKAPSPAVATPRNAVPKTVPSSPVKGKENAKAIYDNAMALLQQKNYVQSRAMFETILQQHPNDTLAPNALYWLGETFYGVGEYPKAITTFMRVPNMHPNSHKAPDALLKIAMSYSALKDKENAQKYKNVLLEKYPNSTSAQKAKQLPF